MCKWKALFQWVYELLTGETLNPQAVWTRAPRTVVLFCWQKWRNVQNLSDELTAFFRQGYFKAHHLCLSQSCFIREVSLREWGRRRDVSPCVHRKELFLLLWRNCCLLQGLCFRSSEEVLALPPICRAPWVPFRWKALGTLQLYLQPQNRRLLWRVILSVQSGKYLSRWGGKNQLSWNEI